PRHGSRTTTRLSAASPSNSFRPSPVWQMSSSIWTRDALSFEAAPARGTCWRIVEAQHHVSTAKLTDSAEEQMRLEELIEGSKPPIPEGCRGLHYLLFTPFRYGAAYPRGSRFRRAGMTPGVYYAS